MRLMEYLWHLMREIITTNITSRSGWKYLVMLRRLGFESCECHFLWAIGRTK